jgi:hypothetical protein
VGIDANLLADNLAALGRDLDKEVHFLSILEEKSVTLEGTYRRLVEEYEDALARAFIDSDGSVDLRKNKARLLCIEARLAANEALTEWNHAKSTIRMQQASLQALHRRVEIGRSLLSREKSLIALEQSIS